MTFLAPLALLGLVAALVPPLLHLFQRRQPPTLEFPAVRYLLQTEREAERKIRLQHLLLMLLRIAAVVLIVLAAARPVVPRDIGSAALHEPTALVLVLDNSLSAGAVTGGRLALDDLKARARETLRAARGSDAVWLVGADGIARRGSPAELLALVAAMRPSPRRLALAPAVRLAGRLVAGSGYARGEVHVLSDLQRSALEAAEEQEGVEGSRSEGVEGARTPLLIYHPAAVPPANLGVAGARPQPSLWLPGSGAVAAAIAGGPAATIAQVQLLLGERTGTRAVARPGATVTLGSPRAEPGWRVGTIELQPDELRGDDVRVFAVRVVAPAVVSAEPETTLGPFVARALEVLAENGQVRLEGPAGVAIGTSVRGAGPVIVLPPADPVQRGALNRALAAAGVAWRYGTSVTREDSLLAPLVPELAGARVRVRARLEAPALAPGDVLARAGGEPWLVRAGRVVLVGSRLVPEETSLPLGSAFVPFVSALVNRVARGEAGVLTAAPGDPVALPAAARALAAGDSVRTVDGGGVVSAPVDPGAYAVLAGRDTIAMLVVGADGRESLLERASGADVRRALGAHAAVTDDPRAYGARAFSGAGRSELTGWLLVVALAVLMIEGMMAAGWRRA